MDPPPIIAKLLERMLWLVLTASAALLALAMILFWLAAYGTRHADHDLAVPPLSTAGELRVPVDFKVIPSSRAT